MNVSNFRLGIGIPLSYKTVPRYFFESWICMQKPPEFVYLSPPGGDEADERQMRMDGMRNRIVEEAQRAHCSHLLMLDTDQTYPVDTIPKLLAHKVPVVSARIRRRYPPFESLLFRGPVSARVAVPEDECRSGALVDVDACGTGCILYDMQVFRTLAGPWFRTYALGGRPVGEDFGWCIRLREAGIPIKVDTSVYVTHWSEVGITDSFTDLFNAAMRAARTEEGNGNGIPQGDERQGHAGVSDGRRDGELALQRDRDRHAGDHVVR